MRLSLCAVLVAISGLVAVAVPNMADFIAVVGAFAVSLLSFVLPPLCYYKMFTDELRPSIRVGVVAFFVASIAVMVFTTYMALKTLLSHL